MLLQRWAHEVIGSSVAALQLCDRTTPRHTSHPDLEASASLLYFFFILQSSELGAMAVSLSWRSVLLMLLVGLAVSEDSLAAGTGEVKGLNVKRFPAAAVPEEKGSVMSGLMSKIMGKRAVVAELEDSAGDAVMLVQAQAYNPCHEV